jgi:ketosteroid isomerase-like protein
MNSSARGPRPPTSDVATARTDIETLVFTYAELLDTGDLEGLADLLSDAVIGAEGSDAGLRGREQILNMFRSTVRIYQDGTPRTKHVTTNLRVEVAGDFSSALARSYFTVFQATPEVPLQPVVAGRYRDRFERVRGAWRFAERRFSTDLVGDMSGHFLEGSEKLLGGRRARAHEEGTR